MKQKYSLELIIQQFISTYILTKISELFSKSIENKFLPDIIGFMETKFNK